MPSEVASSTSSTGGGTGTTSNPTMATTKIANATSARLPRSGPVRENSRAAGEAIGARLAPLPKNLDARQKRTPTLTSRNVSDVVYFPPLLGDRDGIC